jgi:GNAT superfamily N-acetyltransferase
MGAVGAVQVRAWRASYHEVLPPEVLAALNPQALAASWRDAVTSDAGQRLLVSTVDDLVVGFAAVERSGDRDADEEEAELVALEVDPVHRGVGHGSRLLNAAAGVAVDEGFGRLTCWLHEDDLIRQHFLTGAGFGRDGARRIIRVTGDHEIGEVRFVCRLGPAT